jgi:threonine synthase
MIINQDRKNIWRYSHYYSPAIEERFRLTLQEGWTKTESFNGLILKREDQNPTGSIKDRGVAYQISLALKRKKKFLALSSSGNAAISAAAYCQKAKISLFIFLSKKISPKKLDAIKKYQPHQIIFSQNPLKACRLFCQKTKIDDIRPSTDPIAPEGFKSLALEIHETFGPVDSIFIPVSSGATFIGIAKGYRLLDYFPKLYAIQTTTHHPIARLFHPKFKKEKKSLATAICLKKTPRKKEIIKFLKKSKGSGLIISNKQIKKAKMQLLSKKIFTSAEGCACFAAARNYRSQRRPSLKIICLMTGKKYDNF